MLSLPGTTRDRQAVPVWAASETLRQIAAERRARLDRLKPLAWWNGAPFGPFLTSEQRQAITARVFQNRENERRAKFAMHVAQQVAPAIIRAWQVKLIMSEACERFGVFPEELVGEQRMARFVRARQWAMWEIARTTPLSLPRIGKIFGGRDHTTVLHAIRRENERQGAFVRVKRPNETVEVIELPALPVRASA